MGIQLPTDFASQVASTTTQNIAGLSSYTELVIGLLLAVTAITLLIRVFTRH